MVVTPEELCLALKRLYRFENPVIIKHIESGYKAMCFVVQDDKTTFFVKKYHPKRSADRLLEVHRVKKFFHEHGIPTVPPLPNLEGSTISNIQGEFIAVFPYISDKQYYGLPSQKAVASAGENLARLHSVGADHLDLIKQLPKPWNKVTFLEHAHQMLDLAKVGTTSFDEMATKMLMREIAFAENTSASYEDLNLKNNAILHGDYHTHNLFFNENDTVSYIFDFERTMIGSRATDLAYGLFMICFDFNTAIENDICDLHFESASSFIHAYNSVYPIGLDEFKNGLHWFFLVADHPHGMAPERTLFRPRYPCSSPSD